MSAGEQTENHEEKLGTQRRYEQKSFKSEANLKIPSGLDHIPMKSTYRTLLKACLRKQISISLCMRWPEVFANPEAKARTLGERKFRHNSQRPPQPAI